MQCHSMALAAHVHLTSSMSLQFALLSVSDRANLRARVCLSIASRLALSLSCVIILLCRMTVCDHAGWTDDFAANQDTVWVPSNPV